MGATFRVAGVQMDVRFADPEANLARIEEHVRATVAEGAGLTVFPEAAVSGYCFESREEAASVAETIPGPATDRLARLCSSLKTFVIAGMLERDGERLFNAAVLVGPEGLIGAYRKIHLPYLGMDRFATPGDRPFAVWQAGPLRVGVHICYDGAFPESARVLTLLGADLIVLPTNWPPKSECAARHMVNTRALENVVYYMAVNRVGEEGGFRFIGDSSVANPHGETVAACWGVEEGVFYADVDSALARAKRLVRVPGKHEIDRIRDRRPEMYGPIVAPAARPGG